MYQKAGKDDMEDSQVAIRKYINFREKNGDRHEAHILISSDRRNRFSGILYISVIVDSHNTTVVMEGNDAYARDFYGEYSSEYCKFQFINGTLLIQATDRWGTTIAIDITSV